MDKFKQTKLCKALKKNRILSFDYDTGTLTNGKQIGIVLAISSPLLLHNSTKPITTENGKHLIEC
jgi:hypothetical protein